MGKGRAFFLKFLKGIAAFGIFLEIIHHGMSHGVREGRLFTEENVVGKIVPLKGVTKEVFALAVNVHLLLGVDRHDIFNKIKVSEGHSGLKRVDRNAAVGSQHVIHMKLSYALFRLLLEFFGGRGEIGVFISEKLVGNFSGEQNPDVGVLMYPFAEQIHSHAGTDGGYVVGPQQVYDILKGL